MAPVWDAWPLPIISETLWRRQPMRGEQLWRQRSKHSNRAVTASLSRAKRPCCGCPKNQFSHRPIPLPNSISTIRQHACIVHSVQLSSVMSHSWDDKHICRVKCNSCEYPSRVSVCENPLAFAPHPIPANVAQFGPCCNPVSTPAQDPLFTIPSRSVSSRWLVPPNPSCSSSYSSRRCIRHVPVRGSPRYCSF